MSWVLGRYTISCALECLNVSTLIFGKQHNKDQINVRSVVQLIYCTHTVISHCQFPADFTFNSCIFDVKIEFSPLNTFIIRTLCVVFLSEVTSCFNAICGFITLMLDFPGAAIPQVLFAFPLYLWVDPPPYFPLSKPPLSIIIPYSSLSLYFKALPFLQPLTLPQLDSLGAL